MRKGYLLTALAAAVLLAASSGRTRSASVSDSTEPAEWFRRMQLLLRMLYSRRRESPVRVQGLLGGTRRMGDIGRGLGDVTITPNKAVSIAAVDPDTGAFINTVAVGGVDEPEASF